MSDFTTNPSHKEVKIFLPFRKAVLPNTSPGKLPFPNRSDTRLSTHSRQESKLFTHQFVPKYVNQFLPQEDIINTVLAVKKSIPDAQVIPENVVFVMPTDCTDSDLERLITLTDIRELVILKYNTISNHGIEMISHIRQLRILRMDMDDFLGRIDLSSLSLLSKLHTLYLRSADLRHIDILPNIPSLTTLMLVSCKVNEQLLNSIPTFRLLENLSIVITTTKEKKSVNTLNFLNQLPNLLTLDLTIWRGELSPNLGELSRLQSLNLSYYHIGNGVMRIIGFLTELVNLDLSYSPNLTNDDISYLVDLQRITKLNLEGCSKLNNEVVKFVAKFKSLAELNLTNNRQLTDVSPIVVLSELTNLNLSVTSVDDEGLDFIEKSSSLRTLSLNSTKLSYSILREISRLPNLSELNFSNIRGNFDDIKYLENNTSLRKIDMSISYPSDGFQDMHIKILSTLKQLTILNIASSSFHDFSLGYISQLTNLEDLNISYNKNITSQGIKLLSNLDFLFNLNIDGCSKVDGRVLPILKKFPSLRKLNIDLTNVTIEEAETFQRNNPLIKVSYNMPANWVELKRAGLPYYLS